jgi:transcriptional regulator with XRE-family HTH domain
MSVCENLRQYFEQQGMSQQDIADKLGTTRAYVSAILNGRKSIGKNQAEKLSNLFGFSKAWLLTGEGPMLRTPIEKPYLKLPPTQASRSSVICRQARGTSYNIQT